MCFANNLTLRYEKGICFLSLPALVVCVYTDRKVISRYMWPVSMGEGSSWTEEQLLGGRDGRVYIP